MMVSSRAGESDFPREAWQARVPPFPGQGEALGSPEGCRLQAQEGWSSPESPSALPVFAPTGTRLLFRMPGAAGLGWQRDCQGRRPDLPHPRHSHTWQLALGMQHVAGQGPDGSGRHVGLTGGCWASGPGCRCQWVGQLTCSRLLPAVLAAPAPGRREAARGAACPSPAHAGPRGGAGSGGGGAGVPSAPPLL